MNLNFLLLNATARRKDLDARQLPPRWWVAVQPTLPFIQPHLQIRPMQIASTDTPRPSELHSFSFF